MTENLIVVVLAAGNGTRMLSKTNKVLHPLGGRSMIRHVLTAVAELKPSRLVAVVGAQREQVGAHIQQFAPDCLLAIQESQNGTGHATQIAISALVETEPEALTDGGVATTVLVASGDTPLLQGQTLARFVAEHRAAECAVSILSGVVAEPTGYGRIVRNGSGDVVGIVEEKDAGAEHREIHEINSGILAFAGDFLAESLPRLENDNASGEYYLTDLVSVARSAGLMVAAFPLEDTMQTQGANDRLQLAHLARELNRRILAHAMLAGVTIVDPESTWIDSDVRLAPDVTIRPGTQLLGKTVIAEDSVIGPDTTLQDCRVGRGAQVVRSHCVDALIDSGASVGPFSYLRAGTNLGPGGKIGAFVETKNADIRAGAKVPHLSYVGDAEVGEGANIGAGTIFANYDGVNKHRSRVGRHARTASNNTFVAPVEIGDGAATGAGAVIRRDVPPGALAVSSGPQRNLVGWVTRRWPGSLMAKAATSPRPPTRNAQVERTAVGETQSELPGDSPGPTT